MIFKKTITLFYILMAGTALAQQPVKKPLISSVEVFGGPGLSFNYGNKFIENYEDENISNERFTKFSYTLGVGVTHQIQSRFGLNLRFQYEQKGRMTELNSPQFDPQYRLINYKDYTYRYLTFVVAPQFSLSKSVPIFLSVGAYYSQIQKSIGYRKITDTQDEIVYESNFEGRYFEDVDENGLLNSSTYYPGIKSFKTGDSGLILALGYYWSIRTRHRIMVQIVDSIGLTNINRDSPYGQEEFNHSIYLVLGYSIWRK